MTRITQLDLNKFPDIETVMGLLKYDPFWEFPSLDKLGEISERIYGCAKFLWAKPDDTYLYYAECANLRAYLNEFSSLSEILKEHSLPKFRNIAIEKTDYPLFHFFKLLRNVNFHVKSITGGTTSFPAVLMNKATNEIHGEELLITRFIIADCNLTLLETAWDIKHYDKIQIQYIIDWVVDMQANYGISDILEANLRQYCKLILASI